jgi:hypothetical protein
MGFRNAVIGEWCNIEDSNNSNLKNNYEEVKIVELRKEGFTKTGLQFCGLMMGIIVNAVSIPCSIREL